MAHWIARSLEGRKPAAGGIIVDMSATADFLLINASNYPSLRIYPYAFVQVPAIARRHGLCTRRLDLLEVERQSWERVLRDAIAGCRPRVVGLHIRQADSLYVHDYLQYDGSKTHINPRPGFFPGEDSHEVIETVRRLTSVPIVVGGFGFSSQPRRHMDHLRADYGIIGEPDDLFAKFDQVAGGEDVSDIANLMRPVESGYEIGRRQTFPPSPEPEYDDEAVDDIVAFYGQGKLFGRAGIPPHVPVEVMRGCPYRCYFCTEPSVKGRRRNVRDLDVVMADVEFLSNRGIRRVWFVCSEINIGSNELFLRLSERMEAFNAGRDKTVAWTTYFLPNPPLTRQQIRMLLERHFEPAWNNYLSYDDANLKAGLVPYRSKHAVRAQLDWIIEQRAYDARLGRTKSRQHGLFLGNVYATPSTIATTLQVVEENGLQEHFDRAALTRATRLFDLGPAMPGVNTPGVFTIGPTGLLPQPDLAYPTFLYPPHLLETLGSIDAIEEFFGYIEVTFLSTEHRAMKNWVAFLRDHSNLRLFSSWCAGILGPEAIADAHARWANKYADAADRSEGVLEAIYNTAQDYSPGLGQAAQSLIEALAAAQRDPLDRLVTRLGLTPDGKGGIAGSEYAILRVLSASFDSREAMFTTLAGDHELADSDMLGFFLDYYMYRYNVRLDPIYRNLIFGSRPLHHRTGMDSTS